MNITELFKQQIEGGATDQFFYGTEHMGEVRIERLRGSLDSFPQGLEYFKMVGSTPFFRPTTVLGVEE